MFPTSRAQISSTEVWTWHGLVTSDTMFVIHLASRRVHIGGSTPLPNDLFMRQVVRRLTATDDGWLVDYCVLICDRDAKWRSPASLSPRGRFTSLARNPTSTR